MIQVHTMQDGFIGEHEPQHNQRDACPVCGGVKSKRAETCISCRSVREVKRDAETIDRHRRTEACLEAGWTLGELSGMWPFVFSWEQIAAFAPEVAVRYRPDVVIKLWWERGYR